MNRNYYCKVNSQEQAGELLKTLSIFDEKILTTTNYIKNSWNIIGFYESNWCLLDSSYIKKGFIEVPASELIDYVTGKKVDKDALLEEAKRRYPVGTKYKVKEYATGNYYLEGIVSKTPYWSNNGHEDIISGYGGILWSSKHGWSEPIEEPKVEIKFEVGKWYKINNCWYAKFKTIHSSGKYWQHSEVITSKGDHRFDIGNLENTWKDVSIALLKDLSEIQQYLPAGHPDLIKEEFVLPKKWGVKVTDENKSIIHKWKVENTDCSTFTRPGYYVFKEGTWASNISDYTEITFDQFKKYVLKDSVKEEVKPMEEWSTGYVVSLQDRAICISNFKIGNIAQVCGNNEIKLLYNDKKWSGGKINEINGQIKWFPTLQEAQKFSDELLGKSKTDLRIEDLVEGEIYYTKWKDSTNGHIFKFLGGNFNNCKNLCIVNNNFTKSPRSFSSEYIKNLRTANSSEVKWLNTCIKQDKFIPKEDLDKYDDLGSLIVITEYPRYVKLLKGWSCNGEFVGEIFDTSKDFQQQFKKFREITRTWDWEFILMSPVHKRYFKPSTKEAYEAQFSKSEEFKIGDWIVIEDSCKLENGCKGCPEGIFKIIYDTEKDIKGLIRSNNTYLIQTSNAVWRISNQGIRKALPWEIPVENSVKQYPYIPEESIKLDFKVKWNDARYIMGIDPVSDLKTTLSIDDEELPMARPSKEIKITNKLTID